jgi:uncharacterized protein with HEPN domain
MQRDVLLLTEMIDAAEQAQQLAAGVTVSELETDRQRRDALLWNFTVLGEAAAQLSADLKEQFPDIAWQQPSRLRNRIVHGYWSIDLAHAHGADQDVPGGVPRGDLPGDGQRPVDWGSRTPSTCRPRPATGCSAATALCAPGVKSTA